MIFGPKADGIFRTRQLPPGVGYIPQAVAAAQCSDRRRTGASVCASRLIPGDHCLKLGLWRPWVQRRRPDAASSRPRSPLS